MDQIPLEILHNILFRLSIHQKQECLLVCRQWEQTIRSRSLFHTIYIADQHTMDRFIKLVEKTPSIGAQVECLKTCIYSPRLFSLFPNLRTIRINYSPVIVQDSEEYLIHSSATNSISSSSKIESVEEESDRCQFTNRLLSHHDLLGDRLKTLELKATSYSVETQCTKTLARLKQLPVLKTLTIRGYVMTLSDCELILRCKYLSSLYLLNITMMQDDEPFDVIQPTTSVTRLSIDMHGRGGERSKGWIFMYNNWNMYFCKKFTHLTELHYRLHNSLEKQMFESSYSILLKTFPLQLKSFRVDSVRSPLSTIKLLDGFGCQLSTLELHIHFENSYHDIFNLLADSNQCEHIKILTVMSVPQHFDGLEDLIHLRSLYVCGSEIQSYHTIPFLDLNHLLMHCPASLESILIHDCDMLFDTDAAIQQFQYAYIKKLTLKNVYLAECFDTFILTCLPRLVSLTLIETNDIRILNLPNRHFHHLEIASSSTSYISVTLKNDRRPKFYCTKGKEMSRMGYSRLGEEMAPIRKRLEDIMDDVDGWIDLICGEIDHFLIDDIPVVLGFA